MAKIKVGLPSPQYILNILIALAIIGFVLRSFVPERYSQWFRW